ncbi:MAG TPA: hypothetical protein VG675_23905 [Bryobacteraceae bacterium]|nr:hypothetical protein [Bryobacteraceae bacterium]
MLLARLIGIAALLGGLLHGQEALTSLSVPATISGGAMYTGRLRITDPGADKESAGARLMLYPTFKFGKHWFGYAAVQERLEPYFYYDALSPQHHFDTDVIQGFVGYSARWEGTSLVAKAGRMISAFGSFPTRYDDAQNPLLDQPLGYVTEVPLRDDQLPCGVADLKSQHYHAISLSCGGAVGSEPGLIPASLYGLPGVEVDLQSGRVDGRLQITSGSTVYPKPVSMMRHYAQWTLGGGVTVRQGFRIGASGFRGPYLDSDVMPFLPAGASVRNFPASGIGLDVQYKHGYWSASGELQRFRFDYPNFVEQPSVRTGYFEAKRILSPRLYLAFRAGWWEPGGIVDNTGASAKYLDVEVKSQEFGGGIWLNRYQLLKASYEWLEADNWGGTRWNVYGVQLVTSIHKLAWGFK